MFLAAVCALQDYFKWLERRSIDAKLTVHCPNSELEFMVPAIVDGGGAVIENVVHDTSGLTLDGFDQAVKFDPELAYHLSMKTEKHITQVFGMMIGSEPMKPFPNLDCIVQGVVPDCDIIVLPFPGSEVVFDFLCNNRPELDVQITTCTEIEAETDKWQTGLRGRLVVGVKSGLTYLAASAGRAVVEIYPVNLHRNWLSKWGAPMYQMIYGNPEDVRPDLVFRAIEAMWKHVEQRQRALVVPTNAGQ